MTLHDRQVKIAVSNVRFYAIQVSLMRHSLKSRSCPMRWLWMLIVVGCESEEKLSVNNAVPVGLITSHEAGLVLESGTTELFIGITEEKKRTP